MFIIDPTVLVQLVLRKHDKTNGIPYRCMPHSVRTIDVTPYHTRHYVTVLRRLVGEAAPVLLLSTLLPSPAKLPRSLLAFHHG